MMDKIFKSIFVTGLVLGGVVRTVYGVRYRRQGRVIETRPEQPAVRFFMAMWGVAQLLGLVYALTGWLNFANCRVSDGLKWLAGAVGAPIYAAGVWLLWRSHADLDENWSPTLEAQQEQTLVTGGVYRHIRHPMYAAHWLWAIGQALLLPNWIASLSGLLAIGPLTWLRVPAEEQLMLDQFGDDYRAYMAHTGRLVPKF